MYTISDAIREGFTGEHASPIVSEWFEQGLNDGFNVRPFNKEVEGVRAQAYDRGYEVGLHIQRKREKALFVTPHQTYLLDVEN